MQPRFRVQKRSNVFNLKEKVQARLTFKKNDKAWNPKVYKVF